MVRQQPYTTASPVLANYDYNDIADGTGVIEFKLCQEQDSTGAGQFLTTKTLNAFPASISAPADAGTSTDATYTYDIEFNSPRTISGDIFANLGMGVYSQTAGTATFIIHVSVFHYDGTTETQIGSTIQTPTSAGTSSGTSSYYPRLIKIPNCLKIHFKIGDKLRTKTRLVASRTSGVHVFYLGTDPAGVGEPSATCPSKLIVPFKLDL